MSGRCRTKCKSETFAIMRYRDKRFDEQRGLCYYCNRQMYKRGTKEWEHNKGQRVTAEHLTPIEHGGLHTYDNIVAACHRCNSHRGTLPPEWWKHTINNKKAKAAYFKQLEISKYAKQVERRQAQVQHFFGVLMVISALHQMGGMQMIFNAYKMLPDNTHS